MASGGTTHERWANTSQPALTWSRSGHQFVPSIPTDRFEPADSPGVFYYSDRHLSPKELAKICCQIEATAADPNELRGRKTYPTRYWLDRGRN